jgi:hypothetical protein
VRFEARDRALDQEPWLGKHDPDFGTRRASPRLTCFFVGDAASLARVILSSYILRHQPKLPPHAATVLSRDGI